jgi:hypothetical protein
VIVNLALRLLLSSTFLCGLVACSMLPRPAFTEKEADAAQIPGMPDARFYTDAPWSEVLQILDKNAVARAVREAGGFDVLAISGGASDGAFGAGVLNGWTKSGGRPKFTAVTGVSAGALIAPFAFLGPDYDAQLKDAFTSGRAVSLDEGADNLISLIGQRDMRRAALHDLIAHYVDGSFLQAVAAEHKRGRRLLTVTTNLDSQRAAVWNMGAIAASGRPEALALFRDVLIASASIPGAFEPTRFTVTANGREFQELHVDGGVTTNVFTMPDAVLTEGGKKTFAPGRMYVLMNTRLTPEFEMVDGQFTAEIERSIATLLKAHSKTTVLASQEFARSTGANFNLISIDRRFKPPMKASFNTAYMRAAYDYGYSRTAVGNFWQKTVALSQRR